MPENDQGRAEGQEVDTDSAAFKVAQNKATEARGDAPNAEPAKKAAPKKATPRTAEDQGGGNDEPTDAVVDPPAAEPGGPQLDAYQEPQAPEPGGDQTEAAAPEDRGFEPEPWPVDEESEPPIVP